MAQSRRVRFVLMDRDGIINRMRSDYVKNWQEFEVLPGALDAVARLSAAGCEIVILTNQSAIGRGLVSRETVDAIHARLQRLIEARGARLRAFLICPHTPDESCDCRKPQPGLLLRARDELGIRLENAVMIGDQLSDIDAARAAGCQAILVDPQGEVSGGATVPGCTVVRTLKEATDLILGG